MYYAGAGKSFFVIFTVICVSKYFDMLSDAGLHPATSATIKSRAAAGEET
jgi:hypothetical protein